ncbi:MerR family transcriptional regulator [Nakamurella leprariae]|uniref:MerR family transcriptional regulator n=1 Tax=Nakamurella leprariae TaxID=2803911 RepID=A0A938YEM5_9ACTN|nr:MerR family transcriptional regulator [Nakamurella leprariae]MBM9466368.1 MerR family transcriptional regulator [Nakamurella leprariae]
MGYSVGQVAELAGVTVRTLHHWEQVGLLYPRARSAAGYRQYDDADLDRLRDILFHRQLGLSLEAIRAALDAPAGDRRDQLLRQRELLAEQGDRVARMIAALDEELEASAMGIELTPEEKFEIFGPDYRTEWETEAQQRWGDTDAWRESRDRTARFSKQDWERVKRDGDELNRRLAATMAAGHAPDSEPAMDAAEEHRRSIETFSSCPPSMHRCLGDLYVADERFTATYEQLAPGLAAWLRDAIHANSDRAERQADPA